MNDGEPDDSFIRFKEHGVAFFESWSPCGLITLTTDFGLRDPFVGIMKGVILKRFPDARIVDLTHEVEPYWPPEAGFWLARSADHFPSGTVHVAVVDPGVGSSRDSLLLVADGHLFLAPDNGLLVPVMKRKFRVKTTIWKLNLDFVRTLGIGPFSATFHGRDLYAPLAAALASGQCKPEDVGVLIADFVESLTPEVKVTAGAVTGTVVTIDHYGNLITDIDADCMVGMTRPEIIFQGRRLTLNRTYSDVPPGTVLALVNSFGVIEIALTQGNAAETLRVGRGADVQVVEGAS